MTKGNYKNIRLFSLQSQKTSVFFSVWLPLFKSLACLAKLSLYYTCR